MQFGDVIKTMAIKQVTVPGYRLIVVIMLIMRSIVRSVSQKNKAVIFLNAST